jgi:Uma2 family endonuclease
MTQVLERPTNQNEPHRFTVAEFERLCSASVLEQGKRYELLEGEIFEMTPMGDGHAAFVMNLNERIILQLHSQAKLCPAIPMVILSEESQPEPDFMLIPLELYQNRKPRIEEVALVIEISDSTLEKDQGKKQRIYARNGIEDYWIINVQEHQLEVYRNPKGEKYHSVQILSEGQTIAPLEFPDVEIRWW